MKYDYRIVGSVKWSDDDASEVLALCAEMGWRVHTVYIKGYVHFLMEREVPA